VSLLVQERDFRLIVIAMGLSSLGDVLAAVALTIRVHDLTGSGLAVAALLLADLVAHGTGPAIPSVSIPSFSPPLPDVDLGDLPPARGDCGRKSGRRIVVAPCSSPNATLVVNKTVATEGEIPRSVKGAERAHAVRALAQQSCPVDTIFFVDQIVEVVCWARR
jgi:hypothetical protein